MKPDRALIVAQAFAAAVALSLATWLVAGGLHPFAAPSMEIPTAVSLGLALVVLGFFNVWLPRGDAVDTTAAVAFAVGAMLHPVLGCLVVALARCTISIFKPQGQTLWSYLEYVGRRALLVSATFAVFGPGFLTNIESSGLLSQLPRIALASVGFMIVDMLMQQVHASARYHAPFVPMLIGAVSLQGWMLAAEMSVAVLAVLLYPTIGYWGLIVTVGLLLVMRQSFALLLEVRASYTSTVEVLARSIEAYDPARRGHAERVARMADDAARMLGMQGKRLEDLTYAALCHDVGLLGADEPGEASSLKSSEVLSNVGFMAGTVPVLKVLDETADQDASLDENDLVGAYLIAHMSAFDSELNMGGHESYDLANSIGARLYSNTRSGVDRVIRRVERRAREGILFSAATEEIPA